MIWRDEGEFLFPCSIIALTWHKLLNTWILRHELKSSMAASYCSVSRPHSPSLRWASAAFSFISFLSCLMEKTKIVINRNLQYFWVCFIRRVICQDIVHKTHYYWICLTNRCNLIACPAKNFRISGEIFLINLLKFFWLGLWNMHHTNRIIMHMMRLICWQCTSRSQIIILLYLIVPWVDDFSEF